jgi:hypothetical protein
LPKIVVDNGGTDWLTPVATVVAVFVAGFLNWLAQSKLAARRAKDETATATALREAEEKASARVIQGDLAMVASRLQHMVQRDQRWFGFYVFALPHWDQHEAILARALSADDWEVVSQSALEQHEHEDSMRRAVGPGGPQEGAHVLPRDSEGAQKGLRAMWENASEAHRALASLAGTKPEQGLLHEGAP